MFESAELGHEIDKKIYRKEADKLREALLAAQFELKQRGDFPVIVVLAGMPAAGKGELANLLTEWMDPRNISTLAFDLPNDEEAARPPFWRFWRALPAKGSIGIVFGSWYVDPLWHWDTGQHLQMERRIERILRLEKLLTDDGALVLKFWLHLSKDRLKKRLKELESDPSTAWRVSREDKRFLKNYDKNSRHAQQLLACTNQADSSWRVIEGWDANYRALSVGRQLLEAIEHHLARDSVKQQRIEAAPSQPSIDQVRLLDTLQLDHELDQDAYKKKLELLQGQLNSLVRDARFAQHAIVVVFEGMDAAGKGGAIRRITAALDARQYRVVPIAAPSDEEKAQPYLWRFWRHVPSRSRVTLFDRSWYGRVLVERVENFASPAEWLRAYGEINDFEAQLDDAGVIVIKFWLAVSKDEQLARFEAREATGWKRFKITEDDWRNREKWDDYIVAASEMIERTSTPTAPWHLIGANNKQYARIEVLQTLCNAIESRFKRKD